MKQLDVQIMGQSYLLGCPEGGEARLQEAVHRVDTAMCKIRDAGKVRARDRIAVLAALNLAFDLADQRTPSAANQSLSDNNEMIALQEVIARLDLALEKDGQLI